jgi:hypothetical protein
MGKRSRRRNARKLRENNQFEEDTEIKFFLTSLEPSMTESNSDQFKLVKKVKDCISEIYTEHINDLELRKAKRLQLKVPTDYFHPYNLVVNSSYQQKIKAYIKELINSEHCAGFKEDLVCTTDIFIEYLSRHVKEFKGKKHLLQVIILYESYHTLQNSITQIGAIVEDVINRRDFDFILKEKFYSKIAAEYMDLVENIINKESTIYAEDLLRMRKTLESIVKLETEKEICLEYGSTLYSESCSEEDVVCEALHNLPIDDLMKIINDETKKKKKFKSKKKEKEKNEAEQKDSDVEEFKKLLEKNLMKKERLKPFVSQEFLDMLREKIKRLKASGS